MQRCTCFAEREGGAENRAGGREEARELKGQETTVFNVTSGAIQEVAQVWVWL